MSWTGLGAGEQRGGGGAVIESLRSYYAFVRTVAIKMNGARMNRTGRNVLATIIRLVLTFCWKRSFLFINLDSYHYS